jgi:uncharacterized OsmC-like protein
MVMEEVAAAIERVKVVLRRRPGVGIHDDPPARVATDMPPELGGSGGELTPGWLFRAGLASCAATTIAMHAAAEGIDLAFLEVKATSRSDTRGLFGLADAAGRLRELVEKGYRCAPVSTAIASALPVGLRVEIEAA